MNKAIWSLALVWALSQAACGDGLCLKCDESDEADGSGISEVREEYEACEDGEEGKRGDEIYEVCDGKICERGDESCEVGDGKCVVGYDGDCELGQVCFACRGAPKGLQGVCRDGQLDAGGKLVAAVVFESIEQGGRTSSWVHSSDMERAYFFGCPVSAYFVGEGCLLIEEVPPSGFAIAWFGRAPAVLTARVQGPYAEAAQLRAGVWDVEYGCEKAETTPRGQRWTCGFSEGWAGDNFLSRLLPVELIRLWTEDTQAFPLKGSLFVDTLPLQPPRLFLEAWMEHDLLHVGVDKEGIQGTQGYGGAWLNDIQFHNLEVFRNGDLYYADTELVEFIISEVFWKKLPEMLERQVPLLYGIFPDDTFEVRTTVSVRDSAGNEAHRLELTAPVRRQSR